jgi:hypothetical protein
LTRTLVRVSIKVIEHTFEEVGNMQFTYKNTKYRWSPEKFTVNLFFVVLILVVGSVYFTNSTNADANVLKIKVTVENGDTLWSIAEKYADQTDPRKIIDMIKQVNEIKDAHLKVGQELTLVFESI